MKKEFFVTNELYAVHKNGLLFCEGFYSNTDQNGIVTILDAGGVNCKHYVNMRDYSFSMFI